jgi:HD-GYP domain-containing protein (c-di-GMP phosphodiesterase class II)
MNSRIMLFGEVNTSDLKLLEDLACLKNFSVCHSQFPCGKQEFREDTIPAAFISFLSCKIETIIDLFGNLPLGLGETIPYFQMINGLSVPDFLKTLPVSGVFELPLSESSAWNMIQMIHTRKLNTDQNKNLTNEIVKSRKQNHQLVQIGSALSREDNLNKLLETILSVSRDMLCADAGSIYIRERNGYCGQFIDSLRFKVSQNDSVKVERMAEFRFPIDSNSIAGYVALTARIINIDDVNHIERGKPYKWIGEEFDNRFHYCNKSMLTLPLKNLDGEVVGVLQLINKKKNRNACLSDYSKVESEVLPFGLSDEEFVQSVASIAAVSIERAQLYENIKGLFEGFLSSSIAAIDERDRVTSGHSKRVMGYATAFMDAAASDPQCQFSELCSNHDRKTQFQFAALLHDIGKIGVPESVLTKESRLTEGEFETLMARMDYVALLLKTGGVFAAWNSFEELEIDREFLKKINRAGFLSDDDFKRLEYLKEKQFVNIEGKKVRLLTDKEWESLSVKKGNLTNRERELINSHALSTYRILSKIPWTKQLQLIPEIAAHHHEWVNGSGYPYGLKNEELTMESKILSVIDVYEALVAQDRPYKPKISPEKAIQILNSEVENGHLDKSVVEFFVAKGIYKLYLESGLGLQPEMDFLKNEYM